MVTTEKIKQLKELTHCGILECKRALTEVDDENLEVVAEYLRLRSLAVARYKIVDGEKRPFTKQDYIDLSKKIIKNKTCDVSSTN